MSGGGGGASANSSQTQGVVSTAERRRCIGGAAVGSEEAHCLLGATDGQDFLGRRPSSEGCHSLRPRGACRGSGCDTAGGARQRQVERKEGRQVQRKEGRQVKRQEGRQVQRQEGRQDGFGHIERGHATEGSAEAQDGGRAGPGAGSILKRSVGPRGRRRCVCLQGSPRPLHVL